MKALLDREAVRWALPALAMLVVFVLYAAVAAVVVVTSGGPVAMAAAQSGSRDSDDDVDDDALTDDDLDDPDEPATPQVSPSPSVPAAALGVRCEELFSSSVVSAANSAGYVLNPSWTANAGAGAYALQDALLHERQTQLPTLDCRWMSPNSDSGTGIRSVLAAVSYDDALWLDTRLAALGYTAQDELGGTRYFFESSSGGIAYGESHLVVGGIWFSTHWIGYGPKGYTADMVGNYLS